MSLRMYMFCVMLSTNSVYTLSTTKSVFVRSAHKTYIVCLQLFHFFQKPEKSSGRVYNVHLLTQRRKRFLCSLNTEMISSLKLGKHFVCCFKIAESISFVSRESISSVVSIWDSGFDVFSTWRYSKAESVSKSVDNSGSSVLGTAVTGSISAAGASTDGDSLFAGDILCLPKKTKTERNTRK